jgi:hypothetical protein
MLFLIFWRPNPAKVEEVSKQEQAGKFSVPSGLERIEEYTTPDGSSVEIVKADSAATVSKYVAQFLPFTLNVDVKPAITVREYNALF